MGKGGCRAEVPVFSKIEGFARVFDGSFSVKRNLRLFTGLFRQKTVRNKPSAALDLYVMVKISRKA
ncbi:MAG: hypothetical protein ACLVHQ_04370, partial [Oscillospiraceae bacterium]